MLLGAGAIVGAAAGEQDFILSENFAHQKTVKANNSYGSQPMTQAVDGDRATIWRTLSGCTDPFVSLIITLGEETDVNLVYLKPYFYERMTSVKIQYTTDDKPSDTSEWIDAKVFDKEDIAETMISELDTVSATGIRFYADVSQHYAGLYEIELYYADDVETAIHELENPPKPMPKEFKQSEYIDAEIVSIGDNGELIYKEYDDKGAKLIDYSYVGYKRGEEPIPDVKVVKILYPDYRTNHTSLIQDAINEVAALPESERGAILLTAGTYTVTSQLTINASGIVLRGEGQGEDGTIIFDARTQDNTTLGIKGSGTYKTVSGTKTTLADSYVPVGEVKLELSNASSYSAGDYVKVVCTPNNLWVQTLGMDKISGSGVEQWKASDFVMTYERVVTAVDSANNTISIDTGIPLTLDKTYYAVTVEKIEDVAGRITDSGVENIRFVSYFDESKVDANGRYNDEKHAWTAVSFSNCRDCWARDVSAKHYACSTATTAGGAINVTIEGCSYLEPVSDVSGGRRYSFCVNGGQYTLVKNCYSYDSRHDYVVQARIEGPSVFLNSISDESNGTSEPHHRWSTGTLFDNIYQTGSIRLGDIHAINRGKEGTGHGWAGANTVIWNALSPAILVGKPYTEQNFAVGVYGIYNVDKSGRLNVYNKNQIKPSVVTPNYPATKTFDDSPMHGNGYIEAPYNPVNPSSLYKAQLAYRLYGDATKNVIPNSPILNFPACDSKYDTRLVTVSGVADINADKVFVYVDGEQYRATIADDGSNKYTLDLYLENGCYDIYVTQMTDGVEGDRNAIRNFTVDSAEPYAPPSEDKPSVETTAPGADDTTEPDVGGNTTDNKKKNNFVLPVAIIAGCVALGVGVFSVVKKSKKTK